MAARAGGQSGKEGGHPAGCTAERNTGPAAKQEPNQIIRLFIRLISTAAARAKARARQAKPGGVAGAIRPLPPARPVWYDAALAGWPLFLSGGPPSGTAI